MLLHCPGTDPHLLRKILIGLPIRQKAQDLSFSFGETIQFSDHGFLPDYLPEKQISISPDSLNLAGTYTTHAPLRLYAYWRIGFPSGSA
jgi:hypothetical protein